MSLSRELVARIEALLGPDNVFSSQEDRLCYATDSSLLSQLNAWLPDLVVRTQTADQVSGILALANEYRVPVVSRGAGTGQCCGSVPHRGGITMDLTGMNRILSMDVENLQVVVEPGIVHADLNKALAPQGFFFPPDPGSTKMCTLGGMVAFNSSGQRSVKYGTTKQYVLGLEVVLATGERIVTGGTRSRALKSVAGYDLTGLMVGSEGTLGIITQIRLKVLPIPEKRGLVVAFFPRGGFASRVTYHDPCHLRKAQRIAQPPRQLLTSIPGVAFREPGDPVRCCGFGGSFSLTYPSLSDQIGEPKVQALMQTGADAVVTGCPGCMLHLANGLFARQSPARVMHLAEVLVASYHGEPHGSLPS